MFIEYKEGEKHGGTPKNAERSETMDAFKDCGQLLADTDVVIDIDHLPKDSIKALIKQFGIKTETVWTDRGVHFYFKKPVSFSRAHDGICRLAFEIEQHTQKTNPAGMTVKRNGKAREMENVGIRQYMPDIFKVQKGTKNGFKDLTGMSEGEGRNKSLFAHRKLLKGCKDWEKILAFINHYVFAEPMPEDEFEGITRELDETADISDKYFVASSVMSLCHTVRYSGQIWWYNGTEYISDPKNDRLIRYVYQMCEGQDSRYVDEIIKQVGYRSTLINSETAFPIRFNNGVLSQGQFIPMREYTDFTPYYIDINYNPAAEPVEIVDKYIDELTSGDEDYKRLLEEAIGFVMITDPERIRSLGKFFMFRGDGANGKGTLLQIMKKIYNMKNCTNLSIKQLVDDRFKVTMIGKLANLGDDIEAEAIDEAQLKVLKNISTADTVSTRHLYNESESATFTAKLYFTTNSDIKSFEKGYAYKRRILWLPMFNKVEKPDPTFITRITTREALEYWIRLIVEGYKRLYHNQAWTRCSAVDEYNDQYHENNNVSLQFARDLDPETEICGRSISEMRMSFSEWSSDDRKFSSRLFQDAVWSLYGIGLGKKKVNGNTRRVFMRQADTDQKLHN